MKEIHTRGVKIDSVSRDNLTNTEYISILFVRSWWDLETSGLHRYPMKVFSSWWGGQD